MSKKCVGADYVALELSLHCLLFCNNSNNLACIVGLRDFWRGFETDACSTDPLL